MMLQLVAFFEVWAIAIALLLYCYHVKTIVPKGATRLAFILPVVCVFLYLPLLLQSVHLTGTISFFFSWMANFKLLLLAFDKGPLFSQPLPLFLALSCLPIDLNNTPKPKSLRGSHTIFVNLFIFIVLPLVYRHSDSLNTRLLLAVYAAHIYIALEMMLAVAATFIKAILGLDLEPQFNEPYLATSLQDFWGRRWNLAVSRILHTVIYLPARQLAAKVVGRRNAPLIAVIAAFGASGLMHELMFFYLGVTNPSFEITLFFLIHGICLALEIEVKKRIGGRWRLHGVVSGALSLGIVLGTAIWLFLPQFLKGEIEKRSFEDYAAIRGWAIGVSTNYLFIFGK